MNLKLLREKAGLKPHELAVTLGVHPLTVTRWEKGTSRIPADIVQTLAKVYHTTELEILEALKNREAS